MRDVCLSVFSRRKALYFLRALWPLSRPSVDRWRSERVGWRTYEFDRHVSVAVAFETAVRSVVVRSWNVIGRKESRASAYGIRRSVSRRWSFRDRRYVIGSSGKSSCRRVKCRGIQWQLVRVEGNEFRAWRILRSSVISPRAMHRTSSTVANRRRTLTGAVAMIYDGGVLWPLLLLLLTLSSLAHPVSNSHVYIYANEITGWILLYAASFLRRFVCMCAARASNSLPPPSLPSHVASCLSLSSFITRIHVYTRA